MTQIEFKVGIHIRTCKTEAPVLKFTLKFYMPIANPNLQTPTPNFKLHAQTCQTEAPVLKSTLKLYVFVSKIKPCTNSKLQTPTSEMENCHPKGSKKPLSHITPPLFIPPEANCLGHSKCGQWKHILMDQFGDCLVHKGTQKSLSK